MKKGELALRLRTDGKSNSEIASLLGMKQSSVRRLIAETRQAAPPDEYRSLPTHLVIPDTQCQPDEDLSHLYWAGRYAAERKPDVIIHLGDHWDYPSLSSYESRGSKYFEGRRYLADVEAGNEGLRLFEKGLGGWQPRRKVLLRGNHEDRVTRALNEDPRLEGVVGFHLQNDLELGWEVHNFLEPVTIDDITYSHYFYQPNSGRPYSGQIDTILKNVGFTFTMGHQQGLKWGRRELPNGNVQIGLIAGSYYTHAETYRGPQARAEWRGLIVKHEVGEGDYDPMMVSLRYLKQRYAA